MLRAMKEMNLMKDGKMMNIIKDTESLLEEGMRAMMTRNVTGVINGSHIRGWVVTHT